MQEKSTLLKKLLLQLVSAVFALVILVLPLELILIPTSATASVQSSDDNALLLKERDQLVAKVKAETANAQDLKRLEEINLMLNSKLELSKNESLSTPSDLAPAAEVENPKQ